jgi:hypothetical protein
MKKFCSDPKRTHSAIQRAALYLDSILEKNCVLIAAFAGLWCNHPDIDKIARRFLDTPPDGLPTPFKFAFVPCIERVD